MIREVQVHLLPRLFEPEEMSGGIAVVIDVLRASTTITHALFHGAKRVIPCGEVEEARELAQRDRAGQILLGGEREGLPIDGFQLDNNPFAYTREVVEGRSIAFTTTNGTRALLRAARADRVLIGSFVNLQAIVTVLAADTRPVHLVCAGTRGKIAVEDSLCAGAIIDGLALASGVQAEDWADDQLRLALDLYRQESATPDSFRRAMRAGSGGRNCLRLGFDDQIERAGTWNLLPIVPEYNVATNSITIASITLQSFKTTQDIKTTS